ncbi:hypothetical protein OQX61_18660 [Pedobacter sp. PLR]|nr:hypothetical protein [Pedobacter sp. PLR]MCX2453300.1 hypothetical protein [Pedobacter sp. PLR]
MKKLQVKLLLLFVAVAVSGCSIFRPGCQCPHVSYNSTPKAIKLASI